jgi:hypothetical protein
MSSKAPPYAPRKRLKGEALPPSYDTRVVKYKPAKHNPHQPMRTGATDFLKIASKGFPT